jgi:hypothetical protein
MLRYYFDICWTDRERDDPHGTPFPSDEVAYEYAERIVRDLTERGACDAPHPVKLIVRNAKDKLIFSIPFGRPRAGNRASRGKKVQLPSGS